jgi:heat shock protein HslJ
MPVSTSPLVGRTFRVAEIDGVATLDSPTAEITFGDDGRVTGRSTINRFSGPYRITGDTLTPGMLVGTMMAGPPEAMRQEQRFHEAFSGDLTVVATPAATTIDDDDTRLELRRGDDVVLVLVPADDTELV